MRLAYSYIRFSTPEQRKGDSKRRQLEDCEEFCAQNGLVLEKSRLFYDEGKSAYKGRHRLQGYLGKFLDLIERGRVRPGSVLVVEAFDRLSREDTITAFTMFCNILSAGVDVVTLVDRQWFSKESFKRNLGQLYIAIGALWAANNYSELLSRRLSKAWAQKQKLALEQKLPMSSVCPGWLRLSADKKRFEAIPERVKIVKLIFWLTIRGWGKQRIAKLLNRHLDQVPTWGVKDKAAAAWHYSYVQKILTNPAVLGQVIPHTTRDLKPGQVRRPAGAPIKGYFPQIIDEATFLRVQRRQGLTRRKGPVAAKAGNLFQGLLRDGEYPDFSMLFRDHGDASGRWVYVVSDYRRAKPTEPIFSWRYSELESLLLNHLAKLDWSALVAERNSEVRRLAAEVDTKDSEVEELSRQLKRLIDLAKTAGDVQEVAQEVLDLRKRRDALRDEVHALRRILGSKQEFKGEKVTEHILQLARDGASSRNRIRLREAIRDQVERIELFRRMPKELVAGVKLPVQIPGPRLNAFIASRCVRIRFKGLETVWIVEPDSDGEHNTGLWFHGMKVPLELLRMLAREDRMNIPVETVTRRGRNAR